MLLELSWCSPLNSGPLDPPSGVQAAGLGRRNPGPQIKSQAMQPGFEDERNAMDIGAFGAPALLPPAGSAT